MNKRACLSVRWVVCWHFGPFSSIQLYDSHSIASAAGFCFCERVVGKALAYARPHNADDFATPNKKGFVNRLIYDIDLFDGRSPVFRGRERYKDNKDRGYTREQKIALCPTRIV